MTVFVHNSAYSSRRAANEQGPQPQDFEVLTWWNLWRQKAQPYNLLEDGSVVLLLDSWPGGGRISWVVTARRVHKAVFAGWRDATKSLADWSGWSVREVRQQPYTAVKRPVDAGIVLAWQASIIKKVDRPRPPGLVVRRNGWAVLDQDTLVALGLDDLVEDVTSASAPRGSDSERNRAVELHAVTHALRWCGGAGLVGARHVGDDGRSWDIEATDRAGNLRFVEVKGTTGGPGAVMVTRKEVQAARGHGDAHSLVHVHSIEVRVDDAGEPQGRGGVLTVFDPWRPLDDELDATAYEWRRLPVPRQVPRDLAALDERRV